MANKRLGLQGKYYIYGEQDVTLSAAGTGLATVTFVEPFTNPPAVLAVPLLGGAGTLTATSTTTIGFCLNVTGETGAADTTVTYVYFAHEKL
jgi:hypothetical protein